MVTGGELYGEARLTRHP